MCRPPTPTAIEAVLLPFLSQAKSDSAAPITVTSVRGSSPSLRLTRTYSVTLSTGQTLHLVLSPPSVLRLLRFERSSVENEAVSVRWIRSQLLPQPSSTTTIPVPSLVQASRDLGPNELRTRAYSFFASSPRGTPLVLVPRPIETVARKMVDTQVGAMMRQLAELRSPTGGFGPVAAVVPIEGAAPGQQVMGIGGAIGGGGAGTWSLAFRSMLEGILRDGEDMAIGIPYSMVRKSFQRLGYVLEAVKVPRLVVVDGGGDANVLVDSVSSGIMAGVITAKGGEGDLAVTGLHDWSSCIFGDPLIMAVFSDRPSDSLLKGFNGSDVNLGDAGPGFVGLRLSRDAIDDVAGAGVRLLLYQMYHALVSVVKEFYRPRVDSSKREMEARKKLNEALVKLAEIPDDIRKVHRRPSGEMSPAKRLKQGEEGA